jgi:hypothetical protein
MTQSLLSYKFLKDLTHLAICQIVAITTLLIIGFWEPWVGLGVGALAAYQMAIILKASKPWKIVNAALLPSFITLVLLSQLNPWAIFVAFLASIPLVLIYLPTTWTRVPFYRSNEKTTKEAILIIKNHTSKKVLDLGCGWGGVLAGFHRELDKSVKLYGIEVSPLLWLGSVLRFKNKKRISIYYGNFWNYSFSEYDTIYSFLSPEPMIKLWEKAEKEMKSGSIIISFQFQVPQIAPIFTITVEPSEDVLYVYKIP